MNIMIFQSAPEASQRATGEFGGRTNEALFNEALQFCDQDVRTFTLNVADGERLPQGMNLSDFHGVVITGSPLSVYDDTPGMQGNRVNVISER